MRDPRAPIKRCGTARRGGYASAAVSILGQPPPMSRKKPGQADRRADPGAVDREPDRTTDLQEAIEGWESLTPEQRAYLHSFAGNCHHGQASKAANRTRITTWQWRKDSPVFAAAYEVARTVGIQSVEDGGVGMCQSPETFSSQVWGRIMEANDPRYRQKRDVQHSGSVEHVVRRVVLTDTTEGTDD